MLARSCELAAAKNGIIVTQLTIEKLKAKIAKLRHQKFGSSSERIERVISQLELALEEAETAKAEAEASAPQPPELEASSPEAQPAAAAQPEKKKRRQLPLELPRLTFGFHPRRSRSSRTTTVSSCDVLRSRCHS